MARPISFNTQTTANPRTLTGLVRRVAVSSTCLALIAITGCRNLDNAQIDVMERELRKQEDYIYELEDYLIEYSEKLRQCRTDDCQPKSTGASTKANVLPGEPTLMDDRPKPKPPATTNPRKAIVPPQALPDRLPGPAADAPVDSAVEKAFESTEPATPATDDAPAAEPVPSPEPDSPATGAAPEPVAPEEMEPPALEIGPGVGQLPWGKQAAPLAAAPALPPEGGDAAPLYIPDPVDYQADVQSPIEAESPAATAPGEPLLANSPRLSADHLSIRRIFREPPPEDASSTGSLLVVVEALNATNEPVDANGAASLMVMVRGEDDVRTPVDRWDFTAEETAAAWQSSHLGDGLHLELPLGDRELPAGELELWARVVDSGGGKLLNRRPFPFEAVRLASVDQAMDEASMIAAELPVEKLQPVAALPEPAVAESPRGGASPAAKWRASAERLDPDRVEDFASTAADRQNGSTTEPAWKQSSTPTASSRNRSDWAPFR